MNESANGSHYCGLTGYFEWWYFHFVTTGGLACNIVLHETDIFALVRSPYVSMSVHLPGYSPRYLRLCLPAGSIVAGTRYLNVSQEGCCIQEDKDEIRIRLLFPSGEEYRAVVKKLTRSLILNQNVLYQVGQNRSYWQPQVPFGSFDGTLNLPRGTRHTLNGSAYHDHQWGTVPIQSFVKDWVWGHFSSNASSALFFVIRTQTGELIERYSTASLRGQCGYTTGGEVSHLVNLASHTHPEHWAGHPRVVLPSGGVLRVDIDPCKLIRARVEEVHDGFSATYLRWRGVAKLSGSQDSHRGITEYIRIRRG